MINVDKLVKQITAGMPTKYDPEIHISKFLEMSVQGKTLVQIAAEFGVVRRTLYMWIDKNPEFKQTFELGRHLALSYYFNVAQEHLTDKEFNSGIFNFFVSRGFNIRFPEYFKGATATEKCELVETLLLDDHISLEYARAIIDIIGVAASIHEKTELAKILERLEANKK